MYVSKNMNINKFLWCLSNTTKALRQTLAAYGDEEKTNLLFMLRPFAEPATVVYTKYFLKKVKYFQVLKLEYT